MLIHTPRGDFEAELAVYHLPPTFPVVLPICRELGIREAVDRYCPMNGNAQLTHGQVAEFVILHLLQAPHRLPLYQLDTWAAEHNIQEFYQCPAEHFNDDRVGRMLEAVADAIPQIETQVVSTALQRYRVDASDIHWDLTNITFTGAYEGSPLICSGYGHGQLHDRQLQVSLHATSDVAMPVRHERLPGNAHQAPLANDMLKDLQQRLPTSDLLVISDRAGISYDNVVAYRAGHAHFLAPLQITDPAHARQLAAVPASAFQPLSYRSMNAPHESYSYYQTRLVLKPQKRAEPETVDALFVHSSRKQQQDAQQRAKAMTRTLERLAQIASYLNRRQYAKRAYAHKQLAKAVPAALEGIICWELRGEDKALELEVRVDEQALAQAAAADGRYILVYDLSPERTPDEIFMLYRRQGAIEQRFRNLNSDLSVQPLWLQKDARIAGLLAVYILALIVFTLLELCAERRNLDNEPYYHKMTPRMILRAFGRVYIKQIQVARLPAQRELVLTAEQQLILSRLRFPDPLQYLEPG